MYSLGKLKEKKYCKTCKTKTKIFKERNGLHCMFGHSLHNKSIKEMGQQSIRSYLLKNIGLCENCGFNKYSNVLEVCHIKARKKGGKYTLKNVFLLCPTCHKLFDRKLICIDGRRAKN